MHCPLVAAFSRVPSFEYCIAKELCVFSILFYKNRYTLGLCLPRVLLYSVYTVQCVGGDVIMGTVSVADPERLDAEFSQNLESGKMEFYEKVL